VVIGVDELRSEVIRRSRVFSLNIMPTIPNNIVWRELVLPKYR
jgi:hypothetical protein